MTTTTQPKPKTHKLEKVPARGSSGVNRADKAVYGVVLAEVGHFHSPGRGQFTDASLKAIEGLAKGLSKGLKCRFCHPNMSNDGLGKFLGRFWNIRREGNQIRGDLKISDTAMTTNIHGGTPLGEYVMALAEEDPHALETSFVLEADKRFLRDENGEFLKDGNGDRQPPEWIPTKLNAADVVDDGDAVHNGFLSTRNTSSLAAKATEVLDQLFPNTTREELEQRCLGFLENYTLYRFGEPLTMSTEKTPPTAPQINEESIVGKVVEKLAPQLDKMAKATEILLSRESERQADQRAATITALCSEAGFPEKANEYISNLQLSTEEVRRSLWSDMVKRNLGTNAGEQGQNPGGAGGGKGKKELSPQEKAAAEFDESPAIFEKLGFTRETYIASCLASKPKFEVNPLAAAL